MLNEDTFDLGGSHYEQTVFTVTDIQRYIVDPVFLQQTGLSVDFHLYDAYDITVADARRRQRVVLSPALNHLVQKRKIRVGSRVKLTSVMVRFDETTVNGPGIPVVKDLSVVTQQHTAVVRDASQLPWFPESDAEETSHPLASRRGYYMDLWSNTDLAKTADDVQVSGEGSLGDIRGGDLFSVREVATRWSSVQACRPHLLLRVMRRSKLFHYARTSKPDRWPFQLHLVVGDSSGCCMAVFWNVMAPRYLQLLAEGAVVLLRNFVVKPRFQVLSTGGEEGVCRPAGLAWHDVEISVNAHHPRASVTVVQEGEVEDLQGVHLPALTTTFVCTKGLRYVADGFLCDVAGLVTFVGAVHREKARGKAGVASGGFWVKRWIHIQDHSAPQAAVVQLYKGVQRQEFEEGLEVGVFIVCRNLRVVQGTDTLTCSRQSRRVYLTSTKETQLYTSEVDDDMDYPFPADRVVRRARRHANRADRQVWGRGSLGQILFSFPPRPCSVKAFRSLCSNMELVPCAGWRAFLEGLSYRETTVMAVQAVLMAVQFHRARPQRTSQGRRSKRPRIETEPQVAGASCGPAEGSTVYLGYNPAFDQSESMEEHLTQLEEESYLTLQWRGLNDPDLVLTSVRPCHLRSCPPSLSLPALLSGQYDARPGESTVDVPEAVAQRLVEWSAPSRSAGLRRFFVLLDVCCADGQSVVLGVNTAFPLDRHR